MDRRSDDEERGRHSGIPGCCIAFFTGFWLRCRGEYWLWHCSAYPDPKAKYVRCPACLLSGKAIKIHFCSEACDGIPGGRTA